MDNIAVVGIAQTKYERRKKDKTFYDLVFEMTKEVLDDAGLTLKDIDNVITVSNDFLDGRTISSMAVGEAAGACNKNISTVEGDGTFGAFYGAMRVLGGFKTTLVVAHSKGSEGEMAYITNGMFDPIYQRSLGLESITASALQANAYMDRYGIREESFAQVSVKNHGNAQNNPYAHLPMNLTVEAVMGSRKIADPLKLLDCSPISDGAAAIIIANESHASKTKTKPVWIKGVAHCADAYFLGDRDLADPMALRDAAGRAYAMAGITDPMKDLDVVELYDAFSYMEPLWLEGLGVCNPGEGYRLIDEGITSMSGTLPVNPSGGVLSSHAVLVAGLARIIEAVIQLRGEAERRQVPGAKTALAHGINGPCGQSHCVWVLSSEK
ncbi:thiolase family protein [Desulfomonile tiedjei]|uniref:Acetyl-CoA acetyltransferase n=1 Tax=Desulfomonile tiedjei (strain ATCC 49306 / DSM 6799 / DCB-1) TaxID=706587 RepID=I4CEM2_DESTA|nr:thiolase family protein [Desulfomonile tiedjei]AFM28013.1 acetyl-CoA acetyltransferase [Desulfomonile tiedjei DSM 6799]